MVFAKVLLIEDDKEFRSILAGQLEATGEYRVLQEGTGQGGIDVARRGGIDIIVLDVGLPDMDGKDVVRTLRAEEINFPILMLTGQARDEDIVAGLDAGADDYVAKPFRFPLLDARIKSSIRHGAQSAHTRFRVGRFMFVQADRSLTTDEGSRIPLTEKETSILRYLHRLRGGIATKETLLEEVWGYNRNVRSHTVETHVYRLRQKIEADSTNPMYLVTEDGGYKLVNAA